MSKKSIVVLATLDTKGHEAQFLREQIEKSGDRAVVIDTGVTGSPAAKADITRGPVAAAVELLPLLETKDGSATATTADAVWKAYERIQEGTVLGTVGPREAPADVAAEDVNGYSGMELETISARSSKDRATDF